MTKPTIPVSAYRRITKRGKIERVRDHYRHVPHHVRR
jgi:hypothetical protein